MNLNDWIFFLKWQYDSRFDLTRQHRQKLQEDMKVSCTFGWRSEEKLLLFFSCPQTKPTRHNSILIISRLTLLHSSKKSHEYDRSLYSQFILTLALTSLKTFNPHKRSTFTRRSDSVLFHFRFRPQMKTTVSRLLLHNKSIYLTKWQQTFIVNNL